jgi:hypothetical protein
MLRGLRLHFSQRSGDLGRVQQGTLEEPAVDLARHLADLPALLGRHAQVELALLLALCATEDVQVRGPGNFSQQR